MLLYLHPAECSSIMVSYDLASSSTSLSFPASPARLLQTSSLTLPVLSPSRCRVSTYTNREVNIAHSTWFSCAFRLSCVQFLCRGFSPELITKQTSLIGIITTTTKSSQQKHTNGSSRRLPTHAPQGSIIISFNLSVKRHGGGLGQK